MHHVKTQAPYALLVGLISIVTGDLMSGFLYPDWVGLLITIAVVLVAGFFLSAPVDSDRNDAVSFVVDKICSAFSCFRCGKHTVDAHESESDGEKLRSPREGKLGEPGV